MSGHDGEDALTVTPGSDAVDAPGAAIKSLVDAASTDSPERGRLLQVAAIPRVFDERLLADLLQVPSGDPAFQSEMTWLTANPFVHERHNGSWAVHDVVRSQLLSDWDQTRPDELQRLLRLLELAHAARYDQAIRAFESLRLVEGVVREASDDRYWLLAEALEDQLVRAAIEAIHAALRISFNRGLDRLTTISFQLIERSEFRSAEVVVRGWFASEPGVSADDGVAFLPWGTIIRAQIKVASGYAEEALQLLDGLDNPREVGLRFATWYYGVRAATLLQLNRFDEALTALDDEIAIHEEHHVDDVNSATPWLQKSSYFGLLKQPDLQIAASEEAVKRTAEFASTSSQVAATLSLAMACHRWREELETAGHVMRAASIGRLMLRADSGHSAGANKAVLSAAIKTCGPTSARLLAAWGEQLRQLTAGDGPGAELDLLLARAEALALAGPSKAAVELYADARRLVDERYPDGRASLDAEQAFTASALGNPRLGAELNLALLEGSMTRVSTWDRARWLTNAAQGLLESGDYSRGLELIPPAVEAWTQIGVDHALCVALATQGELLRRSGDVAAAESALESASAVLDRPVVSSPHEYLARLRFAEADYSGAATSALAGFTIAQRLDSRVDAVRQGLFAAQCLTFAGRPDEAFDLQEGVANVLGTMADFLAWEPTEASVEADQHAGRALRILVNGFGPLDARARSAIEHLELAIAADDALGWYQAELGWAHLLRGDRKEANKAFKIAVAKLPTPGLRDALAEVVDEI